ncbi:MAG: HD domain-containing protein [Thermoanaerobaculia bacterium]
MTNDPARLLEAVLFAAEKHRNQRRKNLEGSPYINHPIEVASILASVAGVGDGTVLCAAVLHDTLEDTDTSARELEGHFGPEVRALVEEMSDDKSLPSEQRKALQVLHAPHASPSARLIKLADKIANIRDVGVSPPKSWSLQRRTEYLDWAERVVAGLRGTNAALEARFDVLLAESRRALDALGPGR